MNVLYTILIYPITQIIEFVFTFCLRIFKNTGVCVIAISVVISILTLPLYAIAEKWQQLERDTQKRLKTKVDRIKAVFSGDEQYMILTTYYHQNHYHPIFALRSSFGLLIQIPFFIAAYSYLYNLSVLRGTHFLFLNDLGAPDKLIHLLGFDINLLPIVMTVINIIAGAVYLRGFPLKEKIQLYGMAVIFLVLLYNSPSGLVVYWTLNNIFSLLKNIYYKITFKQKSLAVCAAASVLFIFIAYYVYFIYKGSTELRQVIAALCLAIAAVIPCLVIFPQKIFKKVKQPGYTEKNTASVFFFSCAALWVLIGITVPALFIASSPQEFAFIDSYTNPLYFVFNTAMQAAGLILFWPLCIYFLFRESSGRVFSLIAASLLFAALINVLFFPGNYGIISINFVYATGVGHSNDVIIKNLFILIIPAVCRAVLYYANLQKITSVICAICLFAVSGLAFYNIFEIHKGFNELKEFKKAPTPEVTSIEPVFNLSRTGKNTVIIMLDRASSVFVPYIFEEAPELKNIYSGFVYYPNTVSFNGWTNLGAPPIFGGYEYTPTGINERDTTPVVTKHNEALLLMPRLFSEAGFEVTITDPTYPNLSSKDDLRIYEPYPEIKALITDGVYKNLWLKEQNFYVPATSSIIKRNLLWYSLFKASPYLLRKGMYLNGDWCSPVQSQKITEALDGYSVLDYLPRLTGFEPKKENTALVMVNNTTHNLAFYQAPDYRPSYSITNYGTSKFGKEIAYHSFIASLKRIGEWLEFLKKENVYDNTRIILVSDHGNQVNYATYIGLPFNVDNFNPVLLVKDFNSSGEPKTDMTFMTNADVPSIAFNGLIENPVNPWTNKKIDMSAKEKPQYIAISASVNLENPNSTQIHLDQKNNYYVKENIFEAKNWEKAGQ
ncbi:membrane protein [Spirochaetia bacterium]|nr:membrane protein [Spirochaetia bacterium]